MTKFYTFAFQIGDTIHVRGYENGIRFSDRIKYQPTLFVPSKGGHAKSGWRNMFGQAVEPMQFERIREAKDFIEKYSDVSNFDIYGLPRFQYTFLNEEYPGEIQYDRDLIEIANLDIEVGSENGFPTPELAQEPITAITLKRGKKIIAMGCGDYRPSHHAVRYIRCRDERDLLETFLVEWERGHHPEIVTGWNITFFDIPYLVNRISKVLDEKAAKRLSPWGFISQRTTNIMGKTQTAVDIAGVSTLDYLELYKKFTYSQQESYRLDHIAHVELGEKKLDYSEYGSLHRLYKENYQKFIDYNIKDVELVDRLDEKMKLIDMVLALAYDAKVNYTDVFTQVKMWDVLIHNHLWKKKVCVPMTGGGSKDEAYVGAYVKEPLVGAHQWVLSFDLNSLYPHLIMQYNISPEMLDRENRVDITVEQLLDPKFSPPIHKGYSLAANGRYFSNERQGFLPEMMERMYDSRSEYKRKMISAQKDVESAKTPQEKREHEKAVSRYKNMQLAKKVQLNSAYGAIGNPYFRFYDLNQATAITVGGQLSIRWAEVKINEYINKLLGTTDKDYVIAVDTDSLYITLDDLIKKVFKDKDPTKEQIVNYLDKIASQGFEPIIDKIYAGLRDHMNAFAQKMSMKREVIADRGIWTGKKRYILNVHDSEGVRYEKPKLKMMGIEAVKSSTPAACRKAIKDGLDIIMNRDEVALQEFVAAFREQFNKLPFEDISFPRGVQGLTKYQRVEKGIPIHVRASMTYNRRLKQLGLERSYQAIKDGDKVKFCYLKVPNTLNENVLAIPSVLPPEFEIGRYIDYRTQFDKAFLDPLRSILDVIGWQDEDRPSLEKFFT